MFSVVVKMSDSEPKRSCWWERRNAKCRNDKSWRNIDCEVYSDGFSWYLLGLTGILVSCLDAFFKQQFSGRRRVGQEGGVEFTQINLFCNVHTLVSATRWYVRSWFPRGDHLSPLESDSLSGSPTVAGRVKMLAVHCLVISQDRVTLCLVDTTSYQKRFIYLQSSKSSFYSNNDHPLGINRKRRIRNNKERKSIKGVE